MAGQKPAFAPFIRRRACVASCSLGKLQCVLKLNVDKLVSEYTHIWALDENVLLPPSDEALSAFARPPDDVFFLGPAIKMSRLPYARPDHRCSSRCEAHATVVRGDFVEVTAPLMRLEAFVRAARALRFSCTNRSDWGLDKLWCRCAAAAAHRRDPLSVCAIAHPKTANASFVKSRSQGKSLFSNHTRYRQALGDLKHSLRHNPASWRTACRRQPSPYMPVDCSKAKLRC
eukprot:scaffold6556_cov106-Isochrysis_galbana.AAC.2